MLHTFLLLAFATEDYDANGAPTSDCLSWCSMYSCENAVCVGCDVCSAAAEPHSAAKAVSHGLASGCAVRPTGRTKS